MSAHKQSLVGKVVAMGKHYDVVVGIHYDEAGNWINHYGLVNKTTGVEESTEHMLPRALEFLKEMDKLAEIGYAAYEEGVKAKMKDAFRQMQGGDVDPLDFTAPLPRMRN